MFDFGDNVDRDTVGKVERPGDSRLSTNRQQSRKYRRQRRQSTLLPINKQEAQLLLGQPTVRCYF